MNASHYGFVVVSLCIAALSGCAEIRSITNRDGILMGPKDSAPATTEEVPLRNEFDTDLDLVWNAAIESLHEYPIDTANKDIRQIVTKPVRKQTTFNNQERVITLKISSERPYSVDVKAMIDYTYATRDVFTGDRKMGLQTKEDTDLEREIVTRIENIMREKTRAPASIHEPKEAPHKAKGTLR